MIIHFMKYGDSHHVLQDGDGHPVLDKDGENESNVGITKKVA